MYLFGTVHLTHACWRGKVALCLPCPLRPLRRRGRLINRPLQPMKTGGNNPDKRHIWSLSYKTNFNCTPFFKSSSRWRTTELNPCGCRICFSLIALSGYLIRWQMTKTPLPLPLTHKLFHTMPSLFFFLPHTHCTSSHAVLHFPTRSHGATIDHLPSYCWCACQAFCSHTAHMRFTIMGTNSWNSY